MRARSSIISVVAVAAALAGCDDGPDSYGDPLDDPQVPARGAVDARRWLEAGYYQGWHCEPAPHEPRPPSPHGDNRICSNEALSTATGDGPFPVGAAAVKEVFDGAGAIRLFALYRKVADGTGGDTWYWYEGIGGDTAANGEGEDDCTSCHRRADRDFVFTVVRE